MMVGLKVRIASFYKSDTVWEKHGVVVAENDDCVGVRVKRVDSDETGVLIVHKHLIGVVLDNG